MSINATICFIPPQTQGILVITDSSIQPPPGSRSYSFNPVSNDWSPFNYRDTGTGYVYAPINVGGFEGAIWGDSTISTAAKLQLALFFPLIESNTNNPAVLQGGWAGLVETYGTTWLTSQYQSIILGYAQTYNIPLVIL